jgi:hypothetical protein
MRHFEQVLEQIGAQPLAASAGGQEMRRAAVAWAPAAAALGSSVKMREHAAMLRELAGLRDCRAARAFLP